MASRIPPRFCKIIFDPTGDTDAIRIPPKFTQKYGDILPDTVFLKVPKSSRLWEVKVVRNADGEIWLGKGWKKFKDHYSIEFLHYLVFKFDRARSHFKVLIIDMSSLEIEYPVEDVNDELIEFDADDSVIFLRENSKFRKGKKKIVEHISTVQMTGRKRPHTGDLNANPVRKSARKVNLDEVGSGSGMTTELTKELKIHNAYFLTLPRAFGKGTGMKRVREVRLRNADGKTWWATLKVTDLGMYNLGGGWSKFLTANKVTVGSTISLKWLSSSDNVIEARVVDLVKDKDKLFEYVHRIRGKYQITAPHERRDQARREVGSGSGMSTELTKELKIHNAYFLTLPKAFGEGTGMKRVREVRLQNTDGKMWWATVKVTDRGVYNLGGGWSKFLTANKVTVGSTISFKWLSSSDNVIEARVVDLVKDKDKLFDYVHRIRGKYQITAPYEQRDQARREPENAVDTESDIDCAERQWSFSMEMMEGHRYRLVIPEDFVRGTGISTSKEVILEDGEGGEWPVRVRRYGRGRQLYMTSWTVFLKSKMVFEGDTVSFSFIPNSGNVIEARVMKTGRKGKPLFSNREGGRPRKDM